MSGAIPAQPVFMVWTKNITFFYFIMNLTLLQTLQNYCLEHVVDTSLTFFLCFADRASQYIYLSN